MNERLEQLSQEQTLGQGAVDQTSGLAQALNDIIDCGCDRILTSGQKNKAYDGVSLLKSIIHE